MPSLMSYPEVHGALEVLLDVPLVIGDRCQIHPRLVEVLPVEIKDIKAFLHQDIIPLLELLVTVLLSVSIDDAPLLGVVV